MSSDEKNIPEDALAAGELVRLGRGRVDVAAAISRPVVERHGRSWGDGPCVVPLRLSHEPLGAADYFDVDRVLPLGGQTLGHDWRGPHDRRLLGAKAVVGKALGSVRGDEGFLDGHWVDSIVVGWGSLLE